MLRNKKLIDCFIINSLKEVLLFNKSKTPMSDCYKAMFKNLDKIITNSEKQKNVKV